MNKLFWAFAFSVVKTYRLVSHASSVQMGVG